MLPTFIPGIIPARKFFLRIEQESEEQKYGGISNWIDSELKLAKEPLFKLQEENIHK